MGLIPILIVVAALLAGGVAFFSGRRLIGAVVVVIGMGGAVAVQVLSPKQSESPTHDGVIEEVLAKTTPDQLPTDGYVTSESCSECHRQQFHSWHASYHRTMTQRATPEAVFGDFAADPVEVEGVTYEFSRRGDQFWVKITRPGGPYASPETTERPIALTTGSHHMQVYWVPMGVERTLGELPVYYLRQERRWVPRDASFLTPPSSDPNAIAVGRWNFECITCHATHGRTRPRREGIRAADSEVAEFGIACEACHGPADNHVRARRGEDVADAIITPSHLTSQLSAQVCGRCHSITLPRLESDNPERLEHGFRFRPGDTLADTLHLVQRDEATRQRLKAGVLSNEQGVDTFMNMSFWSDGMVRVSGREFNGLSRTACYIDGEMSCLSCHALHQPDEDSRPIADWADDQLRAGFRGDAACTQCHRAETYAAEAHTHHAAKSSGSRCYDCHMPHTTYGLLKAIRSHTIDSPDVATNIGTGRPNACNLCHLDQTLAWTAKHLEDWYDIDPPALSDDQQTVSVAALWSLEGDAGQRALAAWHMGWPPAGEASRRDCFAPFLAALLDDPYPAVRFIAARSLQRLPGFQDFEYDFVAAPDVRAQAGHNALETWRENVTAAGQPPFPSSLLIAPDGTLRQDEFDRLLKQRDDKVISLAE